MRIQKEWKEVKAGCNNENKYSATELQGKRAVIGGLTHGDRIGSGLDKINH